MRTEVSISIKNLEVTRGKRQVLKNINLEINKGSITGLLGPSGCGKTTLMRSIVGVQIIKSGEVLVLDKDAGSKDVRKEVGYFEKLFEIETDFKKEVVLKETAEESKAEPHHKESTSFKATENNWDVILDNTGTCMHCGAPAIPGDYVCYQCNPG